VLTLIAGWKAIPMSKPYSFDERTFLKVIRNHGELCGGLRNLDLDTASSDLTNRAHHVGLCWLRLALEHLDDAKAALRSRRDRSSYSRSYYAAYNASKAIRYVVQGSVSLKGDDHKQAPDLPDDFEDVAKWASAITNLYEHRLKADYDNWTVTQAEMSLTPGESVALAQEFVRRAAVYLEGKFGIKP
jgi:uncharacterized protein (UPF0332 family)